ncbi:MAG: hypothetical protein NT007_09985 [Candidatus Kapabacteria bacterium]|nr:hypothetical protein [Candidatus Kapabacteria bacterium]
MSNLETVQLKSIMTEVFTEVLNSNKELLYNAFYEAFEDFHLLEAIKEGENSGSATREEVFAILEAE